MTKIKIFEMFAGYGGASFALKKARIRHEVIGYSEINKFAIKCYEQNHKGKNYGDCTKINEKELPNFDLLTGGFPCQSFSIAGKGLGELDTRGTLFNDIIRIAEEKRPKYMLLENVKGLTSKRHKETFNKILNELKRIGYNVYWEILNSKDYDIPQNRERVFFVCFRKDLKKDFKFPEKEKLNLFLKDILEDEVEQKYFLSKKGKVIKEYTNFFIFPRKKDNKLINGSYNRVWHKNYCGTLNVIHPLNILDNKLNIRKLTPKECFRLMGFLDDQINLEGLSNNQKYKLAGNGWDINLINKIMKELFSNT